MSDNRIVFCVEFWFLKANFGLCKYLAQKPEASEDPPHFVLYFQEMVQDFSSAKYIFQKM